NIYLLHSTKPQPLHPTLFPYTTLFRSRVDVLHALVRVARGPADRRDRPAARRSPVAAPAPGGPEQRGRPRRLLGRAAGRLLRGLARAAAPRPPLDDDQLLRQLQRQR